MERLSDSLQSNEGAGIQSWFTVSCSSKSFSAAISTRSLFVVISFIPLSSSFLAGRQIVIQKHTKD